MTLCKKLVADVSLRALIPRRGGGYVVFATGVAMQRF
jgi:hypothetical protein